MTKFDASQRWISVGTSQQLEGLANAIGAEPIVYARDVAEAATWGRKVHCALCGLYDRAGRSFHGRLSAAGFDSREMTPSERLEAIRSGRLESE